MEILNENNNIITIKNLTKKYGRKVALNNISIDIPKGKIVGLLGPNGSGKTTLLKILSGLICNYKGDVQINGKPISDKPYFAKWMRPVDIMKVFKDFYKDFDENKMMDMLNKLNLDPKQKITSMSKGMIEKLQLCLTMSRQSLLYIFDEPLGGVDPASRDYILNTIIKNYNPEGTVLISTHLIEDIEQTFDSAIFINKGSITLNEEIDVIKEKYNKSINELFKEEFKCF